MMDLHPFGETMVRALSQQIFESLPHFIERLSFILIKATNVNSQLCRFVGGKNLARNLFDKSSHDVIEFGGSEINHCLALSFYENGNNRSRIASSLTPLFFTLSHTSKKLRI